jgi:hypothetical protein
MSTLLLPVDSTASAPTAGVTHPLAQLALLPEEASAEVVDLQNRAIIALIGHDLKAAQRAVAEMLGGLVARQEEPSEKTEALLELVLIATQARR